MSFYFNLYNLVSNDPMSVLFFTNMESPPVFNEFLFIEIDNLLNNQERIFMENDWFLT